MSYQPAENLTNRAFVGLIIAQFLAGFNDQAIHAAAMFYAINTKILSEANAITLMPILFYAPWAIFCTLAGYFADRYSKTTTLRAWKISEVGIALLLVAGFYFGTNLAMPRTGGWLVMSCVFMMGTHAAFFAPAKYGAMPELLRPHVLSRGNGVLESTTFLASILGTVSGGLLFNVFRSNEVWIGVILLVLSLIGAAASFMIPWLAPASPDRAFPVNLIKPLIENLKVMFRSRPLALACLGIAFFVFMVSYMRASMYMHGETRNPRWDEEKTSLIVATVALGVGLGSPLAGYLSGGKVELGLVPLGCVGMILALFVSAIALEHTWILVIALITIGFFSGFYMVPLYTLLQQRAPKKSKGELVATSNFINVTGAIAATLLFNILVQLSRFTNMTPEIPQLPETAGTLKRVVEVRGKLTKVNVLTLEGNVVKFRAKHAEVEPNDADPVQGFIEAFGVIADLNPAEQIIDFDDNLFDMLSGTLQIGDEVIVSSYNLRGVRHYLIRRADQPLRTVYDNERLPGYLFIGAAFMTLAILFLLQRKLPDFYVRTVFWYRSLGKFQLKVVGMQNLPTNGPVILVCNCNDLWASLELVSATDRATKIVLLEDGQSLRDGMLRKLAQRYNIIVARPDQEGKSAWEQTRREAQKTLKAGHLLAVSVSNEAHATEIESLLRELSAGSNAPLLPVYCGALDGAQGVKPRIRVVFGDLLPSEKTISNEECKKAIAHLGEWIRDNDDSAGTDHH